MGKVGKRELRNRGYYLLCDYFGVPNHDGRAVNFQTDIFGERARLVVSVKNVYHVVEGGKPIRINPVSDMSGKGLVSILGEEYDDKKKRGRFVRIGIIDATTKNIVHYYVPRDNVEKCF